MAQRLWLLIAEILDLRGEWNFEFVATLWIANKKHLCHNIISSAVLWGLWNFRNKICFQGFKWTGEKALILWVDRFMRRWCPMSNQELGSSVGLVLKKLEHEALRPPSLCWGGEMLSRLVMLVSQSLEQASSVATRSDLAMSV
jgi:hypothetical protein